MMCRAACNVQWSTLTCASPNANACRRSARPERVCVCDFERHCSQSAPHPATHLHPQPCTEVPLCSQLCRHRGYQAFLVPQASIWHVRKSDLIHISLKWVTSSVFSIYLQPFPLSFLWTTHYTLGPFLYWALGHSCVDLEALYEIA